jgi:hypothetical protein
VRNPISLARTLDTPFSFWVVRGLWEYVDFIKEFFGKENPKSGEWNIDSEKNSSGKDLKKKFRVCLILLK